ncbi:MAG: cobyric acid synthase, partial [Actinocatenispora sp.]
MSGVAGLRGAVLIAGTSSDAGKSTVVAALCRWLSRQGVRVAPFKAQNMSNNSVVTPEGGEIGRAQALQAAACGLAPSVRFNPVLLKPGADGTSQVVLLGRALRTVGADNYREVREELADTVHRTLAQLRAEYDVVVCEGAGSPAEINLRSGDLVNMGLARAARLPTVLVGDIDRGGVLAAMFGTLAVLSAGDQSLLTGFVVNKFRGDAGLLKPGLDMLVGMTGRPVYGVLPFLPALRLDSEDSLGYTDGRLLGHPTPPHGTATLRVAVVRLPRISNATDVEALAAEPGVRVRLVTTPAEIEDADLVVLPGTRSTVADLDWLHRQGLADALRAHAAAGRPLLGICGGYQMLAEAIEDEVESRRGRVPGLGLLPTTVVFAPDKTLRTPSGSALGAPVGGYEIHHGVATARYRTPDMRGARQEASRTEVPCPGAPQPEATRPEDSPAGNSHPEASRSEASSSGTAADHAPGRPSGDDVGGAAPFIELPDGTGEGCRTGSVFGTHWHGTFEHDEFRRRFLTEVAALAGRTGFRPAPDTRVGAVREAALDQLADVLDEHLDTAALTALIAAGAPPGLPFVPPGAPV